MTVKDSILKIAVLVKIQNDSTFTEEDDSVFANFITAAVHCEDTEFVRKRSREIYDTYKGRNESYYRGLYMAAKAVCIGIETAA